MPELVSAPYGPIWMQSVKHVCLVHPDKRGENEVEGLYDHDAFVTVLAATADGRYLASGDEQGEILVYGMAERRLVGVMRAWGQKVEGLAWESDGEVLVSLSSTPGDSTSPFTEHWRLPGERQALLLHWDWPVEHQWAPDYRAFAWIEDGVPMVHYPAEGRTVSCEWQQTTGYKASMLAWSPDSGFLVSADKERLALWEAATGSLRGERWHFSQVRGVAWPTPRIIVTTETSALEVCRRWHLSHVVQAPPTLPGFPAPAAGAVSLLTDDERNDLSQSAPEAAEEAEEDEPPTLGVPKRYGRLIEEAREAGSCWAEETPEEAGDLGTVYREGQEAPHRRFPAITYGPEEAIYTAAWMVGALAARNQPEE